MAGTRHDIAKLGGNWSDTMLWYARAVGALRARPFDDRTSWSYLGALHGVDPQGWIDQGLLPDPIPGLPFDPVPDRFAQCQHSGWFFLPWHRGYLHAMEAILADWIAATGGPDDWALPYWNYLDDGNPAARDIPREFLDATLPDGDPNPLSQALRGPATRLEPQAWVSADITLDAQTAEAVYTAIPGTLGYGGPISGYAQFGNSAGANEADPHNLVHVMIGGDDTEDPAGWMWDPNFAALDPIFWVHHCNVDRLWAAWMSDAGHAMEAGAAWRNGPFPLQFTMPDPSGALSIFVPEDTLPGEALAPDYDDLQAGTGIARPGPATGGLAMASSPSGGGAPRVSLLGATRDRLTVGAAGASARLRMAAAPPPVSGMSAGPGAGRQRLYLNVEGVKGRSKSAVLTIVLSVPGSDTRVERSVALFGLSNATAAAGPHGGSGLSATVEITEEAAELRASGTGEIEARLALPETAGAAEVTVERISLYARSDG